MSKRRKRKAKRGSVAGATRKRREAAAQGDGPSFLALPEGVGFFALKSTKTARVDIIPYIVGKGNPRADKGVDYWERTFYIHRNVGPNNDWVVCPARTAKKKCPICEFVNTLREDEDGNETLIKALNTSRRMIMNVIDKSSDEDRRDNVIRVWESSHAYFGQAMDEALTGAYEDDEDNMDGFCDAEDGSYLKMVVEKGWQGKGYSVERIDFKSRKEDLDDEVLDAAVCLDDILIIKDYDELKELLLQDDSDDDDEDEPKSKKKKRKTSKKKKDEDEDEFDDEEDEDDDEFDDEDEDEESEDEEEEDEDFDEDEDEESEDEEDEDEDDDEFDDEDEDEEEKPKRKKKTTKKKKVSKKKTTKKKTTKKKRGRKSRK